MLKTSPRKLSIRPEILRTLTPVEVTGVHGARPPETRKSQCDCPTFLCTPQCLSIELGCI